MRATRSSLLSFTATGGSSFSRLVETAIVCDDLGVVVCAGLPETHVGTDLTR